MRKLQLGLIVLAAASVAFVAGCGDGGGTKRKGTIQGANKRAGTAGKSGGGNLGEGQNLNGGKDLKDKTGDQKVGTKLEGKQRDFPDAEVVPVSRILTLKDDLIGSAKPIKVGDIPEGKYELTRISQLVLINANVEGLFHSFDIVPPDATLDNKINVRTAKLMDATGDQTWVTDAPARLEKTKDAIQSSIFVKYESKNEGKKLLLALSDTASAFDLAGIAKLDQNSTSGAYIVSKSDEEQRYFTVLSTTGKIIVMKERNLNSAKTSNNKLRIEFFTYTLKNTDAKAEEKPEVRTSKDDGSKT